MKKKNQWIIRDIETNKVSYFKVGASVSNKKSHPRFTNFIKGGLTVLISVLIIFTVVKAGTITPPGGEPSAQFYTLTDIRNRLYNNSEAALGEHSFEFLDNLDSTHYTLKQIYDLIPTINPSKLLDDTTYLGITGNIATRTLSSTSQTVNAGYYAATTLSTVDEHLISGNIKSGVNLFGIDGDGNVVDTSSGTVTNNNQIRSSYVCFSDGTQYTGSILDCSSEGSNSCYAASGYWTSLLGDNVSGADGSKSFSIPNGYYSGKTCTANDTYLVTGNIRSGVNIFGVTGNYTATYTWTKALAGSWEGVNENLDWAKEIGGTAYWSSQTYSYCGATTCTNDGTLQGAASYTGPPGGWNGSNDYTNFNNSALQNYEVITANNTNLPADPADCTADAGDLVFPDGSVWDKSAANAYSQKLTGCDSNDTNAASIWSAAGGSGSQYAYASNAPSALSIADAWDGKKNLTTGTNSTHPYTNTGKNDDYYDRPAVSWYYSTGDGVGTSRLPMVEEYERARQGTSDSAVSLLYGTTNWAQYNWSDEQYPTNAYYARNFYPFSGYASYAHVSDQTYRLWVVVAQ